MSDLKAGDQVRLVYSGLPWTVVRLGSFDGANVYCKEGHPPKWGGRTNWFYPDEIEAVR